MGQKRRRMGARMTGKMKKRLEEQVVAGVNGDLWYCLHMLFNSFSHRNGLFQSGPHDFRTIWIHPIENTELRMSKIYPNWL